MAGVHGHERSIMVIVPPVRHLSGKTSSRKNTDISQRYGTFFVSGTKDKSAKETMHSSIIKRTMTIRLITQYASYFPNQPRRIQRPILSNFFLLHFLHAGARLRILLTFSAPSRWSRNLAYALLCTAATGTIWSICIYAFLSRLWQYLHLYGPFVRSKNTCL